MTTTEEVRDLLHDLLAWRTAQQPSIHITMLDDVGTDRLEVGFDDGARVIVDVAISREATP